MYGRLIFLASLFSVNAFAEVPKISLGTGYEARMQREVNPDYVEMKSLGQLFGQVRFEKWALHLEIGDEERTTNYGAMKVYSRSINAGAWGRWLFQNERQWQPFVGGGAGAYFDRVTSRYGASVDDRDGLRPYMGVDTGISSVFWRHLLVEAEARISLVRDRKEPMLSALLRAGVYF